MCGRDNYKLNVIPGLSMMDVRDLAEPGCRIEDDDECAGDGAGRISPFSQSMGVGLSEIR